MEFVWAGDRLEKNSRRIFTLRLTKRCDTLKICAVDFYRIFADGKFLSYGPNRTAAGYARVRQLSVAGVKELKIEVAGYNHPCYACDLQLPFFSAELWTNGERIYSSWNFSCIKEYNRITDAPRYSGQRTYVEVYDYTVDKVANQDLYAVEAPTVLDGESEVSKYSPLTFSRLREGEFSGFPVSYCPDFEAQGRYIPSEQGFQSERDFIEETKTGYREIEFALETERTGFIRLDIEAVRETQIFIAMEEYLLDGEWCFRRSGCNDFLTLKVPAGKRWMQSFEPYAFKYMKIIYKGEARITPTLITLENDQTDFVRVKGDEKFTRVFEAARNSFRQNAVDIFMDCPGRERAGWLCDSYFTAKAERLFTGKNTIERTFLENIILSDTEELPKDMLPMCYPSQFRKDLYIPNWAMWFVIELKEYLEQTGDRALVERAKNRVYGLLEFFEKYINEYGLLENLEGWVFIEWSVCNTPEYIEGVNFPSNMLFAHMLDCVNVLYGDEALKVRAERIRETITRLSYDGSFFADNAVRVDGKLVRCNEHVSETCQYYALFFGLKPDETFAKRMVTEFGPLRDEKVHSEIGRSNMFIGNYLRFFWLCEEGEYGRVLNEMLKYFDTMAERTGTLWEHDRPNASCNHGFASVAAVLILRCLVGYKTVGKGVAIFEKGGVSKFPYHIQVEFKQE